MAVDITLLKTPYEISFSGNPMPFGFAIAPYRDSERSQDIRLQVRVLVEAGYNSGTFREVKSQTFYPDYDGMINLDVSTFVDPYLEYFLPNPKLTVAVAATKQVSRYKLNYTLLRNNTIAVAAQDSLVFTAIKGGMSYDEWHPSQFFTDYLIQQRNFLGFTAAGEQAALEELRFLFFLAPAAGTYGVRYRTLSDTGAITSFGLGQPVNATQYSIWCIPAGYKQLPFLANSGLAYCQSYTVEVVSSTNTIVASRTYTTDYRNFYDAYQVLYRNSAGGLENIRLRGQVDFEADYTRQQAQRTVPPSYFANGTLVAQLSDSADESPKFKGDTGFISKKAADKLRDLFVSSEKWEYAGGKLLPISLATKNTKFYSNRDSLITTQIEWQRAYTNSFYTPAGTIIASQSCPQVAAFIVKQINKSKLQIMYALVSPYDTIEVQIIIGANTYTYTYAGNVGSVLQDFTNPATTAPVTIQIMARTVCDPNSVPVSYSAFTTVNLNVIGNSLPTLVDDPYTIANGTNGFNTLSPSVLANDSDPDGDALEVVPNSTFTAAGGFAYIGADGIVTYQAPSAIFVGQDYFDYQAHEVGSTVLLTARIYINVGSGVGVVYVKLVLRNIVTSGQNNLNSRGQVWLDFFANAAGTQPVNITGMGLTINVLNNIKVVKLSDNTLVSSINHNYAQAGTGTQVKVYEDELSYLDFSISTGYTLRTHNWSIRPGNGYTAI